MNKSQFAGLTFLVVDDEPDNVGVVVKLLSLLGGNVFSAANGQEGLTEARRVKPDVILADLSMPVMTGWEMFYHLKQEEGLKHTVVIALTAHAMAGDRERVLQAGFAGYIAKPIDVPVFIPHLTEIVEKLTIRSESLASNGTRSRS